MRIYEVSPEANGDLLEIWKWIAKDSVALADRVEAELYDLFEALARMPPVKRIANGIRLVSDRFQCSSSTLYGVWAVRASI